jgi:hypothetical protein
MPVWDSSLPVEAERVDQLLDALFQVPSIRESGDFRRDILHELTAGWTRRFDELEALRGAVLALAPHRGRDLTEAVKLGREQLQVLQLADREGSTRAQLEEADRALYRAHDGMSAVRWGVAADVREERWITPGDIARSRVNQFDTDGDLRIDQDEFRLLRTATEMVFADARRYEQTFDAQRLFATADEAGAGDGRTTVRELETMLTRWDGNGDGWLTHREFEDFAERGDAFLLDQRVVGSAFG